ncbi:hypothetical protein Tco_1180443, partial [Tanacetum coccineum]
CLLSASSFDMSYALKSTTAMKVTDVRNEYNEMYGEEQKTTQNKTPDLEQPRVQNDVTDVGNEYDEMYGEDYEDYEEEELEKPKLRLVGKHFPSFSVCVL